jgi:LysR family transcriptional regulator, low CO2-responsive transcriptional regulator
VQQDIAKGDLKRLASPSVPTEGVWGIISLGGRDVPPAAAELSRFVHSPRATQAMLKGSGVTVGRFRPSIHVTLWS